ncbi:hypothetical protein Tco_0888028 [Tanacetum coccineum]
MWAGGRRRHMERNVEEGVDCGRLCGYDERGARGVTSMVEVRSWGGRRENAWGQTGGDEEWRAEGEKEEEVRGVRRGVWDDLRGGEEGGVVGGGGGGGHRVGGTLEGWRWGRRERARGRLWFWGVERQCRPRQGVKLGNRVSDLAVSGYLVR